jgi:hypothetical protein
MEEIEYNGKKFLYLIEEYECGDYGAFSCFKTHFFNPFPTITERRKWYLFGRKIKVENFDLLFTLDYSIKSPKVLKEKIQKDLDEQIKLLNREEEIKRGEIC